LEDVFQEESWQHSRYTSDIRNTSTGETAGRQNKEQFIILEERFFSTCKSSRDTGKNLKRLFNLIMYQTNMPDVRGHRNE
jgi:hypothetical protein